MYMKLRPSPIAISCLIAALMAGPQVEASLNVTSYGASTGAADNTTAFQNCINAAQSSGNSVFIPSGTWNIKGQLTSTGITIAGAGLSSTTITHNSPTGRTQLLMKRGTLQDLTVNGANGNDYGVQMYGVGWLVQRVKVENTALAGMWCSGSNGTVQNYQAENTGADGANINNGASGPDKMGAYLTIQNSSADNAHDDGFAINSQNFGNANMPNPKILSCTVTNQQRANGLRIAGGVNSAVQNCSVTNCVGTSENGLKVGLYGTTGYQATNVSVTGNTFTNCGNISSTAGIYVKDNSTGTFSGNKIVTSKQAGLILANCGITFGTNNTIDHPRIGGIVINSGSTGHAAFNSDTVKNMNSGQAAFKNNSPSTFICSFSGNTGF
jgi:hypothetical protein